MQPIHLAAYIESTAAVTDSDINAATDDVLQVRNSHLILSEPYRILYSYPFGGSLTRSRFSNISLQYRGIQHLPCFQQWTTVPTRPEVNDHSAKPIILPMDEEITIQNTQTAVGPTDTGALLWVANDNYSKALPQGEDIGFINATVTIVAGAEAAWTALAAIAMERDLFAGVYSVLGAYIVAADAVAFRMDFRTGPKTNGRKHRPGGLVRNAVGDVPWALQGFGLGEWGRFATFELPSVQVLDDTAGGTYQMLLNLRYLGQDRSLLYQE